MLIEPHTHTCTYLEEPDDVGRDSKLRQDAVRPRVVDSEGGGGDGEDVAGLFLFCVCMRVYVCWLIDQVSRTEGVPPPTTPRRATITPLPVTDNHKSKTLTYLPQEELPPRGGVGRPG